LPTKKNKYRRKLELDSTCNICGCEDETSFHATVACTKSRALREEMRKGWDLPAESLFKHSGPDWLLIMLDGISNERRGLVLMMLRRCWHMRNDVVHEKGECSVSGSVNFLNRYLHDLNLNCRSMNNSKGKDPIISEGIISKGKYIPDIGNSKHGKSSVWTVPENGWIKINVDASFVSSIGSIACICRDHEGKVLWARNEANIKCHDVAEAEARACLFGLQSMQSVENAAIILESDNAVVVDAIKRRDQRQSRLWRIYEDIKSIQDGCLRFEVFKIGRESNKAAHVLASVARSTGHGHSWLGHVPPAVSEIVQAEAVKTVMNEI
jgi:ribonuclease HI